MLTKLNILFIADAEEIQPAFMQLCDICLVAEATTIEDTEKILKEKNIHVVIADIAFFDQSNPNFIKSFKQSYPTNTLILYSSYPEIFSRIYQKLFRADFFVDKSTDVKEIKQLFKTILKNQNLLAHLANEPRF